MRVGVLLGGRLDAVGVQVAVLMGVAVGNSRSGFGTYNSCPTWMIVEVRQLAACNSATVIPCALAML
jgi:hypothetical protein